VIGAFIGIGVARLLTPADWFDVIWKAALVIAAAVTLPLAGLVIALQLAVHHNHLSLSLLLAVLPRVFITALVMTAIVILARNRPMQTHAGATGAPPPKFLARLPAKLAGAELYAVEAEDHYLRLHTSLGQDLILMRLSDAIAELEGIEGAQTHRSWWVAKGAVTSVERGDGRATLTLKDGSEAPVSRGYAGSLRASGWF
jgi:DNA-binding LytR/AlgR family response regulator